MDRSWIAGHLTGGLGNRLFQHAAAAGLAEQWNMPLIFHLPSCAPTNHGPFDSIFRLFPDIPVSTDEVQVAMIPEPPNHVFRYSPLPDPRGLGSHIVIDGFRQTDRYFPRKGIHPNFENAIGPERSSQLLAQFGLDTSEKKKQTWFIHIRLGDYKILPHHQINLGAYYSEAVKHIPVYTNVLVFSDQAREYTDMFQAMFAKLGVSVRIVNNIEDELETLYLMSQCWGGAVVANSTFSWWGSYFAHQCTINPETYKGVFPTCWGAGLPEATDIIPSWGIRVHSSG